MTANAEDLSANVQAALAGILLEPDKLADVAELILPQDIPVKQYRELYEGMLALDADGIRVEAPALIERMPAHRELILTLDTTVPTASNLAYYAKTIAERALRRRLQETCADLIGLAREWRGDTAELLSLAEQRILGVRGDRSSQGFKQIGEILTRTMLRLEKQLEEGAAVDGIPTGLRDVDDIVGGFRAGQLVVLAAKEKMGKTAFALQVANHVATAGGGVGFFSLEMTEDELGPRLLANLARVNGVKFHNARAMTEQDWNRLSATCSTTGERPLFVDDTLHTSITEVRSKARRLAMRCERLGKPLRLVVLDYLQLAGEFGEHREQEIAAVSRGLKALAKELKVVVMALSQLNRALDKRVDKRPVPGDLRDSGSIAQDADLVMFLYRDVVYDRKTARPQNAEVIISLNRSGPTGTAEVTFEEKYTRFSDLPKQEQLQMPEREEPPPPRDRYP